MKYIILIALIAIFTINAPAPAQAEMASFYDYSTGQPTYGDLQRANSNTSQGLMWMSQQKQQMNRNLNNNNFNPSATHNRNMNQFNRNHSNMVEQQKNFLFGN